MRVDLQPTKVYPCPIALSANVSVTRDLSYVHTLYAIYQVICRYASRPGRAYCGGGSSCFLLFSPAAQSHSRDVPKYRIFQYFSLQVTIYCTRYLVFSMLCLEIACFAVLHILHVQQFFLFMHGGHEGFVGYDFMQYVVPTNILNISRIIDLFILSDLVRRDPSFLV